jgi:hypothetical protein
MHNEHHMLLQHHHYVVTTSSLCWPTFTVISWHNTGTIQLKKICEHICIVHLKPFKTYTMQTINLKFPQFHKYKIQQLTMKHMQVAQLIKNHKSQAQFCKPLFSIP